MRHAGFDPTVGRVLLGLGLIVVYLALCLSPLVIVSIGYRASGRPFLVEFSVGLGYVALAMMILQFFLVSRVRWLAAPFGVDILHRFHREVSFVAVVFILLHPVLLLLQNAQGFLPLLDVWTAPWRARLAVGSLVALLLLVMLSIWRRPLRVPYDAWKGTHNLLALAVIVLGLGHMIGVNRFTNTAGGRVVVGLSVAAVVGITLWTKSIAPRRRAFRPWRVVEVARERGGAITLVLRPEGHPGWSFLPGQFAWLTLSRAPLSGAAQHPLSLSSPGDVEPGGAVALTIKGLGDWSQTMGLVETDTRVYLDGPHGSFSIDLHQAPGYVLVGGGVGITPLFSMVATMCERGDTRRVTLIYTSPDWEAVTFREQLDHLSARMPNLEVVHVLRNPPRGWTGEWGRIDAALLRRHLPPHRERFECFVCAGESMMDAVERALIEVGVPDYRIHTERFAMV
jgi:predicted ferric reductase